jgi:hypothetical protein
VRDQDLSMNIEDVSMQPPNVADFLSPKMMQAVDLLLKGGEEGMADLPQSSKETPPSPSFGHQNTPVDIAAVDAAYFEGVAAEVAAAATHAVDSLSPAVRPLERGSAVSMTAKALAFPLAAGAADVLASMGEPATAAESAGPHVIDEDASADEDASGGEWWW